MRVSSSWPLRSLWLASLLATAPSLSAQATTQVAAQHRFGQTFLTWREVAQANVHYRVYRSTQAIRNTSDLATADLLGEVDDRTSRNKGRSLATGVEWTWIVRDGGAPLAVDTGLFVHTAQAAEDAFYAVTSVVNGVEDTAVRAGTNATRNSVAETPEPPHPVLQSTDSFGELLAHWVGDRDTPFQPALSPRPSDGFNFRLERGSAPGPHGLVVRLHAAGQTYSQGWPQRFEVPQDVDILALSDLHPYTSWTFWFGAQELLPSAPTPNTRVWNYTQQRVMWTLDWAVGELGATHDPERVYVLGGSMGAIGGMYLLNEHPERFAAGFLRNGIYDLFAPDYRNMAIFQTLFGSFSLNLLTRDGMHIFDRTNAITMANQDRSRDWPLIRTISGRNDLTVGWFSAVELMHGLADAQRPAVHYFDEREHTPHGYWEALERVLLNRTFQVRRNRPLLRFSDCSLDDDPGQGARDDGDPVGTINGYLDFDPTTAQSSASALTFDVYLRDQGQLDDAPAASGWAALTPRRTGAFALGPGEVAHYTLREAGVLQDEHWLRPDVDGLLRTPLTPLSTTPRQARFERQALPGAPALFLGGAPRPGDPLQLALVVPPDDPWGALLALGDAAGPFLAQSGVDFVFVTGQADSSGWVDLRPGVPAGIPAGLHVWARAFAAGRWTPWAQATLLPPPAFQVSGRGQLPAGFRPR